MKNRVRRKTQKTMREKMKKKRNKESQNEIEIETRRRINEILHKIKENEKDEEA